MKSLISIVMCCISAVLYGQDEHTLWLQEADRYFELEQFSLSSTYYRRLADGQVNDPAVIYRLAECYRKTFDYEEAEQYYFKARHLGTVEAPLSWYYYALMLKLNGKYEESIKSFEEFIIKNQCNDSIAAFIDQAMIDRAGSQAAVLESSSENERYTLTLESFNSTFNDYAPAVADSNRLMFTSGRISSVIAAVDERYGEAFTDNYCFEKRGGRWYDRTRQLVRNLNSRFNEGSGSFNREGDKYYFTVCGKEGSKCRIVFSELRYGKWTDPFFLNDNVNWRDFESKHPAVSPGGDTLLFVSDRAGGFGGFDIWMSVDSGENDWGPAMNLGSLINTKMNEIAPAFAGFNHVFFFASDGHQGFGGMDLYMGKRFSDGVQSVYNLGHPFNSNRDDCFVSFATHELYISSNRDGGTGNFDIYSSVIKSPLSFISRLSIKNEAGRNNIVLASLKSEGSWMDLFSSSKEDRIEYENLTYDQKKIVDRMIANTIGHKQNASRDFSGIDKDEYNNLLLIAQSRYRNFELQRQYKETLLTKIAPGGGPAIAVTGVLVDSLSDKPLGQTNIFLMNEQGEVLKVTSTNSSGIFRFTNVPGSENLYLRLEGQGASSVRPLVVDLVVVPDTPETFTFENIYFDTDHYDLRIEAKAVLNKLGDFLKLIPDSQVEIFAYADDRGSDDYNFQLSKKRGEAVRAYLGRIGVDETSVAVVAKGRQTQYDDLNNDEKRQFNRRVEFYINGENSSSLITADNNK